jgi:hypothetical protein
MLSDIRPDALWACQKSASPWPQVRRRTPAQSRQGARARTLRSAGSETRSAAALAMRNRAVKSSVCAASPAPSPFRTQMDTPTGGVPNRTDFAACFWPDWMPTRRTSRKRSAKPSAPQSSRSRLHWRHARKQPTQNTAAKKGKAQGRRSSRATGADPLLHTLME